MKATIEFEDALYRRLKAEAALSGRKVRDMVAEGVRRVLAEPGPVTAAPSPVESAVPPAWFGSLRQYAANAQGHHDLAAVRESITKGRQRGSE